MNPFSLAHPKTFEESAELFSAKGGRFSLPVLKAGGMDVVDHLKEGLAHPDLLIDVKSLRSPGFEGSMIREERGRESGKPRMIVEGMTTLAEIAGSSMVNERAPVLAQAAGDAASPQVRNVATAAGNLLQRPRCWYYRNDQFHCLKKGGHHCYAVEGENKFHAIFSDGPCYIVHPSNLAPALYVLNGNVHLTGSNREALAISDLFHDPEEHVRSEHRLTAGEVITQITFEQGVNSGFYAVKEKQSFDWPLVFACVSLDLDGGKIASARVCAGAVAPRPWPMPHVEEALIGVDPDDEQALRHACSVATKGAKPMTDNRYKVRLLPVVVRRAVRKAAGLHVEDLWS